MFVDYCRAVQSINYVYWTAPTSYFILSRLIITHTHTGYAMVQNGYACMCTNNPEEYTKHGEDPTGCTKRCPGAHKDVCGGVLRSSVFATRPIMANVGGARNYGYGGFYGGK